MTDFVAIMHITAVVTAAILFAASIVGALRQPAGKSGNSSNR